jgi:hypothetical protein
MMEKRSGPRPSILPEDLHDDAVPRASFEDVSDGGRSPSFLNLWFRRGTQMALPYDDVIWVGLNPSSHIKLIFASHSVTIRGTTLHVIYRSILRRSASDIRECDERYQSRDAGSPFVRAIETVQRPTEDEDKHELFSLERSSPASDEESR